MGLLLCCGTNPLGTGAFYIATRNGKPLKGVRTTEGEPSLRLTPDQCQLLLDNDVCTVYPIDQIGALRLFKEAYSCAEDPAHKAT